MDARASQSDNVIPGYDFIDGRYFRCVRAHERAYVARGAARASARARERELDDGARALPTSATTTEERTTEERAKIGKLAMEFIKSEGNVRERREVEAKLRERARRDALEALVPAGRARGVNVIDRARARGTFTSETWSSAKFQFVECVRGRDGGRMLAVVWNSVASLNVVESAARRGTTLRVVTPAPVCGAPMPCVKAIGDGVDGMICANWCGKGGASGGLTFAPRANERATFVALMDCVEDVCRSGTNVDEVYACGSHGVKRAIEGRASKESRVDDGGSGGVRAETLLRKDALRSDVFAIDVDVMTPKVLTLGTRSGKVVEFDARVGKGIEACAQVAHLAQENIYQVKKLPPHRASDILVSSSAGRYRIDTRKNRVETIASKRDGTSRTSMGFADDFFSSKMGFCDDFFSYAMGKHVHSREYDFGDAPLVHTMSLHPVVRSSDFAERNIAIGCEIDDRGDPNVWAINENGLALFSNVANETSLTQIGVDDEWCAPFYDNR